MAMIFLCGKLYSQNIITIEVKDLSDVSKITISAGGRELNSKDTILFKDTTWKLRVITHSKKFSIQLQNNLKPFNLTTFAAENKEYKIENNTLSEKGFKFGNSFQINILNSDDSAVKSYSRLSYLNKNEKADTTKKNTLVTTVTPDNYKYGSVYYDALYLADTTNKAQTQLKILAYYAGLKQTSGFEEIKLALDSNEFLKNYLKLIEPGLPERIVAGQQNNNPLSSLSLSSIGGLDVTNIADGFAKFLVKRTKEELNITFFSKFKETITNPAYIDLQTVFPQTYRALLIVGDEIYNYEAYIQTLRESFENDLSTLDKNLPSIIKNHPGFFNTHPELAATLNSSCYIAGALEDKVHPGDILKEYPAEFLDNLNPNWKGAIQTLQLVSASLRDSSMTDSVYWVNTKQIKELVKNTDAFKIYFGLLYQVARNNYNGIKFNNDFTLLKFLNKIAPDFTENRSAFENYISRFVEKTNKLNVMIKNYNKPANDSLAFEQYYNYFKSSVDLIQYSTEISKLPVIKNVLPNLADTLKNYFDVAHSTADLVLDIKRRNYASAVTNAVHIYDLIKSRQAEKDMQSIASLNVDQSKETKDLKKQMITAVNSAADVNALRATDFKALVNSNLSAPQLTAWNNLDSIKQLKSMQQVKKDFFKYGTFMATLVQAKTSDDVEKSIEAFALPTGSSRIKRETDFNVSLNAYVGPYLGGEYLPQLKQKQTSFSAGLTAPVGIAFSWGNKKSQAVRNGKTVGGKSISLFIPVVDIGALASYRFADDSSSVSSVVQLKNIISPGLYVYYGLGKCPVSIGLGAQMGPQLRTITAQDINVDKNIYVRFGISIAVDIPVLNFYTKSR